jgi:hypothetical protein
MEAVNRQYPAHFVASDLSEREMMDSTSSKSHSWRGLDGVTIERIGSAWRTSDHHCQNGFVVIIEVYRGDKKRN